MQRFALPYPGYRHGTPKSSAIPTSLHPDIQFLSLYHGEGENQRLFCLWSFLWSKPLLCRFQRLGEIQQTQVLQGFAAFASPYPGYRHGTPKAGALPTALHPVVKFLPIQTAYVSGLTFILTYILYINTAESAIFFSTRLPHCAAISLSGTALLHISATRYIFNSLNAAKIAVAWYSCM